MHHNPNVSLYIYIHCGYDALDCIVAKGNCFACFGRSVITANREEKSSPHFTHTISLYYSINKKKRKNTTLTIY